MKKKMAAWIALAIITLVAALALALTNEVTKDVIAKQEVEAEIAARKAVLPEADAFEELTLDDMGALSKLFVGKAGDETKGFVGLVDAKGYGGPVQVIAGVNEQGVVTGVSVGGSAFAETAGLGAKAKEPAFYGQFTGKQSPIRVVKTADARGDNTVDAITAATITTNAVTGAVNSIASTVDAYLHPDDGTAAEGTTYTASEQGFAGPVAVLVTVKDDGTISALSVGDESFAETDGFGAAAKESAFTNQFVGKSLPLTIEDIDAISGATVTSKAVVAAINKAYEEKKEVLPEGTRYTASQKGFAGPVAVFVTAKDDGTITALKIGDEQFAETDGFGLAALEPAFAKQFVGKTIPLSLSDIDAISGATLTSQAVVDAINQAFTEKLVDSSAPAAVTPASQEPAATEAPAATQAPADTGDAKVYTATVDGYKSPVTVSLTLDAEGKIATLVVGDDKFDETAGLGSKAREEAFTSQFIGKTVPVKYTDIDMITAATVTSEAVWTAVNKAVEGTATEEATETAAPAGESSEAAPASEGEAKVYTASVDGFKSPVAVSVTLDAEGKIASLTVGDDKFDETAGLGSKAQDEAFTSQFIGKTVPVKYSDVDLITAATVTSEAVVDAINKAVAEKPAEDTTEAVSAEESTEAAPAAEGEAKVYTATVDGFKSPVTVSFTLDAEGKIATLTVGDDQFAETEGLGSKAREEAFTSQFIGKTVPVKYSDVDLITAATVTSEAVVDAINKAVEEAPAEQATETAAPAGESSDAAPAAEGEAKVYTATVDGFKSPVAVSVTLDAEGKIASLTVGDDKFDETAGLGSKAQEEGFTSQFIGKAVPVKYTDIDMITAATVTSEAVVDAINKAVAEKPAEETTETSAPAGESGETAPADTGNAKVYTATVDGFKSPVTVSLTLDAEGKIATLTVGDDQFAETEGLGSKAREEAFTSQFIGRSVPVKYTYIDMITAATVTSEAVWSAVNKAVEEAPAEEATETAAPAVETTESVPAAEGEAKVYTATVDGFKSPVTVSLTLDAEGKIATLTVGDDQFAETEGLGSKARDEAFTSQFIGKTVPVKYSDIDMITAATVTSEAVWSAINKAVEEAPAGEAPETVTPAVETTEAAPAADGEAKVYTATVDGFKSPVTVSLTLDAEGKIATLTVGDDQFAETEGLGSKARDEAFTSQFIGKTVPVKYTDIDTITAATVTSEAVWTAVNKSVEEATAEEATETAAPAVETTEVAPAAEGEAKVYTATVDGFKSPVTVSLTLDAEGKIATLTVGDEQFAETEGLGSKAREEAFTSQFIGKTVPVKYTDIDMITAATVTSEAVWSAINKAVEEAPAVETSETVPAAEGEAKVYTATVDGFKSPVAVSLTLDAEGKIATLTVGDDRFNETEGLGSRAKEEAFTSQFIGKTVPVKYTDVDLITAATVTSEAVVDAINKATTDTGASAEARQASASVQGFRSPVAVTLTLAADNTIAALTIGDEAFAETKGLGDKVLEDSFIQQFIGKAVPLKAEDIDMVSGATETSEAVIKAINEAATQLLN